MNDSLAGLTLHEALALIADSGQEPPVVEISLAPTATAGTQGRDARVVLADGKRLVVSYFKTGAPEG